MRRARGVRRPAKTIGAAVVPALIASACGSAQPPRTAAEHRAATLGQTVCTTVLHGVGARLHRATVEADGSTPAYLECRLAGDEASLDAVAEGVPQAYDHYNTVIAHQVQTYADPGGIRDRGQLPRDIPGLGVEAAWIPAQHRLIATNGTLTAGGSFVTVTVSAGSLAGPQELSIARAAARAMLAAAPHGSG